MNKKIIRALIVFAIVLELLAVTVNAKTTKSPMYRSAKTTATLKFKRCAEPALIYTVKPDKRCDKYIVVAGIGLKNGKIKKEVLRNCCIGAKAIKNGWLSGTIDTGGNGKYLYFKCIGRDKKTKLYYQAKKVYKVNMRTGKVVEVKK